MNEIRKKSNYHVRDIIATLWNKQALILMLVKWELEHVIGHERMQ